MAAEQGKRGLMKQPQGLADKPGGAKRFANFNRGVAGKGNSADATFARDEACEASPGVGQALAAIDARTPAVLIAGRAGTGKTRLVQYIKSRPSGELQATVAPTGIAALNAQAQTIHSFFHLEHAVLDAKNLSKGGKFGSLYRRMNRLVVDEISMVRADVTAHLVFVEHDVGRLDPELAALGHGVARVENQIEHRVFELVWIAQGWP